MCVEPFESETAVLTLAMFFAAYRETCCELGEGRPPGLDRRARRRWRNERPRSVEMSRAEWSLLFRRTAETTVIVKCPLSGAHMTVVPFVTHVDAGPEIVLVIRVSGYHASDKLQTVDRFKLVGGELDPLRRWSLQPHDYGVRDARLAALLAGYDVPDVALTERLYDEIDTPALPRRKRPTDIGARESRPRRNSPNSRRLGWCIWRRRSRQLEE